MVDVDLELDSWILALRAERRSAHTVRGQRQSLRDLERWMVQEGCREVSARVVRKWLLSGQERGWTGATAQTRLTGVRAWAKWAAEEGLLSAEAAAEVARVPKPRAVAPVVKPFSDDELKRLLRACGGDAQGLRDRAALSMLLETGVRVGELLAMELGDLDVKRGIAVVQKSKTGSGRVVPFGPQTGRALDRWLRARKKMTVRAGSGEMVWLGMGGRALTYHGLRASLVGRAEAAGVAEFHVHKLRNTAAVRWLRAGGSENGLRTMAGWSPGSVMLARYVKGAEAERAIEESRGLDLGL